MCPKNMSKNLSKKLTEIVISISRSGLLKSCGRFIIERSEIRKKQHDFKSVHFECRMVLFCIECRKSTFWPFYPYLVKICQKISPFLFTISGHSFSGERPTALLQSLHLQQSCGVSKFWGILRSATHVFTYDFLLDNTKCCCFCPL